MAALEASGAGTWRWDFRANEVDWDMALVRLFNLDAASAPRKRGDFRRYVHPDDQEQINRAMEEAMESGGTADYEFRAVLPDGSQRWMYTRSRLLRDARGGPSLMVGACLDITERKRAQERQALLVQELNHRVKNTLSVVQSLALHTRRGSKDLDTFQEAFESRLMALSATHNILTQELWESASLKDILDAEMIPYGGLDNGRVNVSGEPVRLKPQQALGFGLALHELATNAAKYGALSVPHGRLDISWRAEADASGQTRLAVDWVEQGGPAVEEPKRLGFGSRGWHRPALLPLVGRRWRRGCGRHPGSSPAPAPPPWPSPQGGGKGRCAIAARSTTVATKLHPHSEEPRQRRLKGGSSAFRRRPRPSRRT
ncbi:sensor histidine kinase [Microvirga sp. GCM10011540]|uniref:sensor histidine kinase n=1 Tax=Microvirga sp. GCM10011540 TaxID=3317338 RepID=UPI00362082CC